ncbi:hypothetical protein NBRC10512_005603 [Rhodotorula toruloides]|uniref:RHTO0S15e01662g1_1 n=2 Tax=Rhodotorula toruloides TaxID=5286 RepID=A0A061BEG9_RHOTO|nr:uncharacterized protein RHTO_03232 [Rhodotorula toruloides NP11]EMS25503.1 hypothetical protein RHTO_03232 [Rhodotorula toruloides NP11]CDR47767.1 RHTO0S15e01662g1_1 [Rhodotorula toruloides]
MTAAVRPQTIEIGSRFPAWDKENSLCFEIAFRRLAVAGDFEPCWNRQSYTKSHYDWSCNEPAQGDGFCTFSASLSTDPTTGEARVTDVCLEHAHPQCEMSPALREDLRKELEAACDELEEEAKSEFVKLRRAKRGSTTSTDTEVAPHVAQQLVVWDVWVAAGKERAERFEQALLAEGRAAEGYPTGGIFGDETNSLSTDPLDHPLAKISPLNNPPSPPSSATARLDAAPKSPDSPSTTPKGVSSKNKTTLVSQMKGKQRRSVSVVEVDLTDLPVTPTKRKKVKASSTSAQDTPTSPERQKTTPSSAQSSLSSLSASPQPRTTSSSHSSRTREGAPTPTPPGLAIKREMSPELGIATAATEFHADGAGAIPPMLRSPTSREPEASPAPTLVEYLSTLDPFGGFDYSSFAPTLEYLGIKNGTALERWAKTDEKLKVLVKKLAKPDGADELALMQFEEDLRERARGAAG